MPVRRGVKRHPNTNVRDISQGTSPELSGKEGFEAHWLGGLEAWCCPSQLWQKQKNLLFSWKRPLASPGHASLPTAPTVLVEAVWSCVVAGCRISCLNVFLMKQGHSSVDVLPPQAEALWIFSISTYGTSQVLYILPSKWSWGREFEEHVMQWEIKGLSLPFVVIGCVHKTKHTHICHLWKSVNYRTFFCFFVVLSLCALVPIFSVR